MSPLCYTAVVKICGISLVFISFAFILQKKYASVYNEDDIARIHVLIMGTW